MASTSRIWIVLPAYNEEQGLPLLLNRVADAMREMDLTYSVIVIDDGSTDSTLESVRAAAKHTPIVLERHERNQGLGPTMRDGFTRAFALASDDDVIVTMDADNTHPPELIPSMTRAIEGGCDVVIASRYRPGSRVIGVPPRRRMLSALGSLFLWLLFPIRGVRDYTCGYRAYRAGTCRDFFEEPDFVDAEGFQVMVDILLKLRRRPGLAYCEVPLVLHYDLKAGESKMKVLPTIVGTLRLALRRALSF